MKGVTAHFEFSGTFWTVMLVVFISVVAWTWRDTIKTVLESRARQAESGSD